MEFDVIYKTKNILNLIVFIFTSYKNTYIHVYIYIVNSSNNIKIVLKELRSKNRILKKNKNCFKYLIQ